MAASAAGSNGCVTAELRRGFFAGFFTGTFLTGFEALWAAADRTGCAGAGASLLLLAEVTGVGCGVEDREAARELGREFGGMRLWKD